MAAEPVPHPDPYAALGLTPAATPAEVRRAYRRLARTLHPDVNSRADAAAAFATLQAAYAVVGDPKRRAAHDRACAERAARGTPHVHFSNIAGPGPGPAGSARTGDPGDPSGFDEIYEAFFAPRARARPRPGQA